MDAPQHAALLAVVFGSVLGGPLPFLPDGTPAPTCKLLARIVHQDLLALQQHDEFAAFAAEALLAPARVFTEAWLREWLFRSVSVHSLVQRVYTLVQRVYTLVHRGIPSVCIHLYSVCSL